MKPDLIQALTQLPASLAVHLKDIILNPVFAGQLSHQQVTQIALSTGIAESSIPLQLLPLAAAYAYSPISNFNVGAIARGTSGALYFGANMEFSGTQIGQTIHAEQAAIANAWMAKETSLTEIIVDTPPCGHCRQFMTELAGADALHISLPNRPSQPLHCYLPECFGPQDLGVDVGLMSIENHHKQTENHDPLIQSALTALNKSHAPYSQTFSGIALQMANQQICLGAYAENAAFNPSLPPLQVALVQVRMAGLLFEDIERAVLAELNTGKVSQREYTLTTLKTINPNIQYDYIEIQ